MFAPTILKPHREETGMDWRDKYRHKIVTADEAVGRIRSNQVVVIASGAEPLQLTCALDRRADSLCNVRLIESIAQNPHVWYADPPHPAFQVETNFITDIARPGVVRREIDFFPSTVWALEKPLEGEDRRTEHLFPDVTLIMIGPPDADGVVSLGTNLWTNRTLVKNAKLVLAEVNETYPHLGGEGYMHLDDFDLLVDPGAPPPFQPLTRAVPPEELEIANNIGALTATLIRDGDTFELGYGLISSAIAALLTDRNDLGYHSENLFPSVLGLVKSGNLTGRRKTFDVGKHVSCGMFINAEDYPFVDRNPAFEIRDASYTNDPKVIARHDNFVSVNAAISVDLTGQINAEAFGPVAYSGIGGQLDFQIGALLSKGGRAITVLPSTARNNTVSRICALMPEGQAITVPRTFADFIVTEYGIASLQGKTQRQRAAALIEIAHPTFRDELRHRAKQLYG
jgi:4-hydroxybutyrate CoA-transferase